jgi:hypothetical protein
MSLTLRHWSRGLSIVALLLMIGGRLWTAAPPSMFWIGFVVLWVATSLEVRYQERHKPAGIERGAIAILVLTPLVVIVVSALVIWLLFPGMPLLLP